MKFELYSVKDVVADELGPVFQCKNDDVAVRMYGQMFTKKESIDLALFKVGHFDTEKGLKSCSPKLIDTFVCEFRDEVDSFDKAIEKACLKDTSNINAPVC